VQLDNRSIDDSSAAADHRARTQLNQAVRPESSPGTPTERPLAGGPEPVSRAEQGQVDDATKKPKDHRDAQQRVRARAEEAIGTALRLPADTRVEIKVDMQKEEVRFVIRDRATGEVVREVPNEEAQSLLDKLREFSGVLVDRAF